MSLDRGIPGWGSLDRSCEVDLRKCRQCGDLCRGGRATCHAAFRRERPQERNTDPPRTSPTGRSAMCPNWTARSQPSTAIMLALQGRPWAAQFASTTSVSMSIQTSKFRKIVGGLSKCALMLKSVWKNPTLAISRVGVGPHQHGPRRLGPGEQRAGGFVLVLHGGKFSRHGAVGGLVVQHDLKRCVP